MEASSLQHVLEKKIAFLSGGRDHSSNVVLVFPYPFPTPDKQPGHGAVHCTLKYLASSLSTVKEQPVRFAAILDGRRMSGDYANTMLRAMNTIGEVRIVYALVIKPDFWLEKQRLEWSLKMEGYRFPVEFCSMSKLTRYVDRANLPDILGGKQPYDHEEWLKLRLDYERFVKDSMVATHSRLRDPSDQQATELIVRGRELSKRLRLFGRVNPQVEEQTTLRAQECGFGARCVDAAVDQVKSKANIGESHPALANGTVVDSETAESKLKEKLGQEGDELYRKHKRAVNELFDWTIYDGEQLLFALHEIGDNLDEANALLVEHDGALEKAHELHSRNKDSVAPLVPKLLAIGHRYSPEAEQRQRRLEAHIQSFQSRAQHQRIVVEQTVRFYELYNELTRELNEAASVVKQDGLIPQTSPGAPMLTAVDEATLAQLHGKHEGVEKFYDSTVEQGEALLKLLQQPELTAEGREVTRDYLPGMFHIQSQLDDVAYRRKRFGDVIGLCRARQEQRDKLGDAERDVEQAIGWIDDVTERVLANHGRVGKTQAETDEMQAEDMQMEETARKSYEHGRELTGIVLLMRRSCLPTEIPDVTDLEHRLENSWGRFCRAMSEHVSQLNISLAFHENMGTITKRLETLETKMPPPAITDGSVDAADSAVVLDDGATTDVETEVHQLRQEISDLRRVGATLMKRINDDDNLEDSAAVNAIDDVMELASHRGTGYEGCEIHNNHNYDSSQVSPRSTDSAIKTQSISSIRRQLAAVESAQTRLESFWHPLGVVPTPSPHRDDTSVTQSSFSASSAAGLVSKNNQNGGIIQTSL